MKYPALLTIALIVVAGASQAQSPGYPAAGSMPNAPMSTQAPYGAGGCGHAVAITDEYKFRYDNEG